MGSHATMVIEIRKDCFRRGGHLDVRLKMRP